MFPVCDRELEPLTVTVALDLDSVKAIKCAECLGQRSFHWKVIVGTHTHTHTRTQLTD